MAREYFTLTATVFTVPQNNPAGSQIYTLNGDDKAWVQMAPI